MYILVSLKTDRGENGKFMRYNKELLLSIVLSFLLALTLVPYPVSAQTYGPCANNLLVHIYLDANAENADLEAGTLDVIDWALTKYWIDKWTGNPDITMRSYAGFHMFQFDLNNQRWPTGVTLPRTYDAVTETYKHYQDYADPWEAKAREFRRALAYLSDKDGYIDRILKGYGYRMDTPVPTPFLAGYVNPDVSGLNYPYIFNPAWAAIVLDNAGFIQGSTPNPHYDNTQPWSPQYLRIDPKGDWSVGGAGTDLKGIIFYARLDDESRTDAAKELTLMMRKSGIPVDLRIRSEMECLDKVMTQYDFHIYTGNWGDDFDLGSVYPDFLYNLHHSSVYYGGTETSYYGGIDLSFNYVGFVNSEFDYWAEMVKYYWADGCELHYNADKAQEILVRDVASIPLWASAAFKAYRSKWTGIVNIEGRGVDNEWSFMNMNNSVGDTSVDKGFVGSTWDWWKARLTPMFREVKNLGKKSWETAKLVLEGLFISNPFMLDETLERAIASNRITPYLDVRDKGHPIKERGVLVIEDVLTLKSFVTFQWSNLVVTPESLAVILKMYRDFYSLLPGVSVWTGLIKDIYTKDGSPQDGIVADPTLGEWDVKLLLEIDPVSQAVDWTLGKIAGKIKDKIVETLKKARVYDKVKNIAEPLIDKILEWLTCHAKIMNPDILKAANIKYGWGYGTPSFDPWKVLEYSPWTMDANDNGIIDIKEIGTGPWIFESDSGPGTTWINFAANRNYHISYEATQYLVHTAFHQIGNVNWPYSIHSYPSTDSVIDLIDGSYIRNSFGTTPAWPHGTKYEEWNVDCDFDEDNEISTRDLWLWGSNHGREMG